MWDNGYKSKGSSAFRHSTCSARDDCVEKACTQDAPGLVRSGMLIVLDPDYVRYYSETMTRTTGEVRRLATILWGSTCGLTEVLLAFAKYWRMSRDRL